MSFIDEFNSELDGILQKRDNVAKIFSIELNSAVIKATPVRHGDLRKAWTWSQVGKGHFRSSNNLEYAISIDQGYRSIGKFIPIPVDIDKNGKTVWRMVDHLGSKELPDGFQPIIEKEEQNLQRRLKDIK